MMRAFALLSNFQLVLIVNRVNLKLPPDFWLVVCRKVDNWIAQAINSFFDFLILERIRASYPIPDSKYGQEVVANGGI